MFWLFGGEACRVLAPDQGLNPYFLHWKVKFNLDCLGSPGLIDSYRQRPSSLRMSHADPLNNKAFETLKNHCPIAISPGKIHLFTWGGTKSATRRLWTKGSKNEYRWGGNPSELSGQEKPCKEITSVSRLVELSGFMRGTVKDKSRNKHQGF